MLTKFFKFHCMWITVDFCPSIVDSQASEQLSEQTSYARHGTWHVGSWEHIKTMDSILWLCGSPILMKMETLIWGTLSLEKVCLVHSWATFSELRNYRSTYWVKCEGKFWDTKPSDWLDNMSSTIHSVNTRNMLRTTQTRNGGVDYEPSVTLPSLSTYQWGIGMGHLHRGLWHKCKHTKW